MNQHFLTFSLREERFAVNILKVREIIPYSGVAKVPLVADHIRGVINLRGNVVAVIDPSVRLGKAPGDPVSRACILIMDIESQDENLEIGLLVDAVNEVTHIHAEDIEPPPDFGTGIRKDFIQGMVGGKEGFVIILDVDRFLSPEELSRYRGHEIEEFNYIEIHS